MSFHEDYFEVQRTYEEKYGKVVVVKEKGSHYNIFEYIPWLDGKDIPWGQGNTAYYLANSKREHSSEKSTGEAINISIRAGFTLTSENKSKPHSVSNPLMIGFPWASYDNYVERFNMFGYTVVRIDQTGENDVGGSKKREISEIVSPGTNLNQSMTNSHISNNLLAGIYLEYQRGKIGRSSMRKNIIVCGLSVIDISSGESTVSETYSKPDDENYAIQETYRFLACHQPVEIVIHVNKVPKDKEQEYKKYLEESLELGKYFSVIFHINKLEPDFLKSGYHEQFLHKIFEDRLKNGQDGSAPNYQPGTSGPAGIISTLNLELFQHGRVSYIFLLQHCYEHKKTLVKKLQFPKTNWTDQNSHLILTHNCIDQMEILPTESETNHNKLPESLIGVLDSCSTKMGSRYLRKRLLNPLTDTMILESYYNMTQELIDNQDVMNKIGKSLKCLPDLEILQRKIQLETITPKELVSLLRGYLQIQAIYLELFDLCFGGSSTSGTSGTSKANSLKQLFMPNEQILDFNDCLSQMWNLLDLDKLENVKYNQRVKSGNKMLAEESFFRAGCYQQLDEISENLSRCRDWLNSARDKFNTVLNANSKKVTLEVNRKKDNNFELNAHLVTSVASAKHIICSPSINRNIYGNLESHKLSSNEVSIRSEFIDSYTEEIEKNQSLLEKLLLEYYECFIREMGNRKYYESINKFICELDFVVTNANNALKYNYFKPQINTNAEKSYFSVKELRHPLIERRICDEYIPNDVELGRTNNGMLLYGVNSTGKTSLGKSIGLMIIMAQCGMFVAGKLEYKPYTKMVTRLSGGDNLIKGQSSFVVEVMELKTILLNSDESTMVIGDELCRGTETTSGEGLTLATIKFLNEKGSTYTFSTHMHKLPKTEFVRELVEQGKLQIYHLSAEYNKSIDELVLNRKLEKGAGSDFYGLEVCKSLNLPNNFIDTASKFCQEYSDLPKNVVSTKKSRYNSKIYVDECSLCKTNLNLDTHHLQEQNKADERGFISHYHKNSSFNLLVLCKTCHQALHKSGSHIERLQTLSGAFLSNSQ